MKICDKCKFGHAGLNFWVLNFTGAVFLSYFVFIFFF